MSEISISDQIINDVRRLLNAVILEPNLSGEIVDADTPVKVERMWQVKSLHSVVILVSGSALRGLHYDYGCDSEGSIFDPSLHTLGGHPVLYCTELREAYRILLQIKGGVAA